MPLLPDTSPLNDLVVRGESEETFPVLVDNPIAVIIGVIRSKPIEIRFISCILSPSYALVWPTMYWFMNILWYPDMKRWCHEAERNVLNVNPFYGLSSEPVS